MKARVKDTCTMKTVTACGGLTYVKNEFRTVPAHEEENALINPFLEIEPVEVAVEMEQVKPAKTSRKKAEA